MGLATRIVDRIRRVTGNSSVALHEPCLTGNELAYVKECLESGWVSSVGSYVDRFEQSLAAFTGVAHVIAVNNGTSGLQVALQLVGVRPGDEVLVPALSFVATANAVSHCGAVPHFVESNASTLGIDIATLALYLHDLADMRADGAYNRRTGRRIAAVVPMHTFGHPVDMPALQTLAEQYALPIVEDAAESLGSWIGSTHTGNFGRCAVLSFNGNKIVTTGGGGAILTNDATLATRARHVTTTAKQPHAWAFFHDEVGYNFRMPNINAALGCGQLERLEIFLAAKRELTQRYLTAFSDLEEAALFVERPGTQANYWLQTLLLAPCQAAERDAVLAATNAAGQMTRPVWELLPTLPMYRNCASMPLPIARDLAARIINLPSSPQLIDGVT